MTLNHYLQETKARAEKFNYLSGWEECLQLIAICEKLAARMKQSCRYHLHNGANCKTCAVLEEIEEALG